MTQWEYMVVKSTDYCTVNYNSDIDLKLLNDLGRQGWELVCHDKSSSSLIFKRPKDTSSQWAF